MLHKSTWERYEKLRRVFHRLMNHFNVDDLDDFVQTANSLREWIRLDENLTTDQKAALERFCVNESVDWQICNQIANHQKHKNSRPRSKARIDELTLTVTAVEVKPGATGFLVPPSMRVIGAGDEIIIEWDGQRESALGFVIRTFRHFHFILEVIAPGTFGEPRISMCPELFGS